MTFGWILGLSANMAALAALDPLSTKLLLPGIGPNLAASFVSDRIDSGADLRVTQRLARRARLRRPARLRRHKRRRSGDASILASVHARDRSPIVRHASWSWGFALRRGFHAVLRATRALDRANQASAFGDSESPAVGPDWRVRFPAAAPSTARESRRPRARRQHSAVRAL